MTTDSLKIESGIVAQLKTSLAHRGTHTELQIDTRWAQTFANHMLENAHFHGQMAMSTAFKSLLANSVFCGITRVRIEHHCIFVNQMPLKTFHVGNQEHRGENNRRLRDAIIWQFIPRVHKG